MAGKPGPIWTEINNDLVAADNFVFLKDAAKAALQRDQAQRDYYTANYGVDPKSGQVSGLLANYANNNQPLSFDTSPASLQFQSPGRFEYDKTKRKVVFVPASQPQQQQVA